MERSTNWVCATLCSILFVFIELIAFSRAYAFESSCPASISTGQPACGESSDIGSNAPSIETTVHVGNPVDVASGNKYQSDVDVRLADSILSLVRHYNSAQSNVNIGLGNGWRHSYSVMLSQYGDNQLQIVQSDGRRMTFVGSNSVFHAVNEADGFISVLPNGRHVWNLPDGRRLLFVGSFLAKISSGNEELVLHYQNTRLVSVTDSAGRSIEFEYAPGNIGLPSYTPGDESVPAGHLRAIVLPDTTRVEYKYDHQHNLISVKYPRGTIRSVAKYYRYEDDLNRALLTERANALDVPVARWTYDNHERVSSYRSGWNIRADGSERGLPDLKFEYSEGASPSVGRTTVYHRGGGVRVYEWRVGDGGRVQHTIEIDYERIKDIPEPMRKGKLDLEREVIESQFLEDNYTVLEADMNGHPKVISHFSSIYKLSTVLEAEYATDGVLLDLAFSDEYINMLPQESSEGSSLFKLNSITKSDVETASSYSKGIVLESARFLLNNTNVIQHVDSKITIGEKVHSESIRNRAEGSLQRKTTNLATSNSPANTICSNALNDCSQLRRIMNYAELAQCAYAGAFCQTSFTRINPTQLGILPGDLVEGAFRASIFYDAQNDEYIVSFAGTNALSAGDWSSNARQELGWSSFHYEKAIRLARELSFLNPNLSFTYTGHSLGGGLATAAVAAGHGDAVVFNPAGFNSQAASTMSVSFTRAEQHTDVFSVNGEILRILQAGELLEDPPGLFHSLRAPSLSWILSNTTPSPILGLFSGVPITLHSMDSVVESISGYLSRNVCPP